MAHQITLRMISGIHIFRVQTGCKPLARVEQATAMPMIIMAT